MPSDKIEISIDELKREVKEFLLSIERDRITPRPVQRIGDSLDMLRRYMAAVVRANDPRDFSPGAAKDPEQSELLRQHREVHFADSRPDAGLIPLRVKLKALDCTFVLAGEVCWRLDEADWEV
jgi:hypothetical protein